MERVTLILGRIRQGKADATAELFSLVYDELKRIAESQMAREKVGQTLQPTALVHEAFLRLVDSEIQRDWISSGHFFAIAAEVMRRVLIDNARRKKRIKHGGEHFRIEVALEGIGNFVDNDELLALDQALEDLGQVDPIKAKLIVLRYFGGMSIEQACEVLGISRTTAHRYWTYARAWLFHRMGGRGNNNQGDRF